MQDWQRFSPQRDRLGESPFWHPVERRLYWVDIPGRQLRCAAWDGSDLKSWPMPQEPGCIAPARGGGLVVALRDGMYRARRWGGALDLLHRFAHDPRTTRFNDGKADPLGRFWAGTIYEPKDQPLAELHCLDGTGGQTRVRRMAGDATTANGLAWSPAGDVVYWSDTPRHVVFAWDWNAQANTLGPQRVFHQFTAKPPGWQPGQPGYGGRPDGAAVDADGNYWCAMYEGTRLVQLSPAGQVLRELPTPMLSPTMPCFGGDDLRTLFVTGSDSEVWWRRIDVAGLPVNFFID
ncbi:MAG TPA: SMP-30/gluconolactonase/LRE family protein [Ramlibacter sp.]|nr:SMP-30/gluconolactonase/LRE family protein [Ramlibacter sp.]